ncbi:MAG TPA: M48 family metalloprotease [Pirellulales bacterium]|nr:M48 family metalloprotease [Pirellulales bacterium]
MPRVLVVIAAACGAFLPAWLTSLWLRRKLLGREFVTPRRVAGQIAFNYLLMFPHVMAALFLLALLPARMDFTAAMLIALSGAAVAWFGLGGGAAIVRRLGLLLPVPQAVDAIVARAAQRAGVAPRGVYQLDCSMSNAFALWGSRDIVFTKLLLEQMTDAEIEAIAAHELAHLNESRLAMLARLAACLLVLPLAAAGPIVGSFGLEAYLGVFVFTMVALILNRRFGRRMEQCADRQGHAHQADEGVYARALEKLYCANLSPAVLRGNRHVHPHLYDRMAAAGVAPAYERPAPPSSRWRTAALVATCLPLVAATWAWNELPRRAAALDRTHPIRCAALILRGSDDWASWFLSRLASESHRHDEVQAAITYLRASASLDEQSPVYPARLALVLASVERCPEAEEALTAALQRQPMRESPSRVRAEEDALVRQAFTAVEDCGR